MRKEELRASLAKIQPREELIISTINKMNEQRLGIRQKRSFGTRAFAYRLATALCALVVVMGLGVFSGVNQMSLPDAENPLLRGADVTTGDSGVSPASLSGDDVEMLSAMARSKGGEWAIVEGHVQSCFFLELTEEQKRDGVIFLCGVEIVTTAISEGTLDASLLPTESESLSAVIKFTDAEAANEFFSVHDAPILFSIRPLADSESHVWSVDDYIIIK